MWRDELIVYFRKGYPFFPACVNAGVPADMFNKAREMWARWDVVAAMRGR
jgi:hypothetical protein